MSELRSPRALAIALLLTYVIVAYGVESLYPWSSRAAVQDRE